jgi:drug/metabolite transporter (DMT)-like permease
VLIATVYALIAAVLHAGWNLFAKRSVDPFVALWSQFLLAGLMSSVVVLATGGLPAGAWAWAGVTGLLHVPYIVALGWAYHHGDFSLAYPVARGGGALLAAIGGLVLLDDELKWLSIVAILLVVAGMSLLAKGAPRSQVAAALVVAASIGAYTVVDSHAARTYDDITYVFATFVVTATAATISGLVMRRGRDLLAIPARVWSRTAVAAVMSVAAYGLVLLAVRDAPVGYVAALRESSVLIAAVVGTRLLGEGSGKLRTAAAALIVAGLITLVIAG